MTPRRWAVAAAMLGVLSACSSHHRGGIPATSGTGASPALIAAAKLRPCPASSVTPVAGGLPDVTVPCLGQGPAVHLGGLTGMPTVINVWGSWCIPCQKEAAYLSAAYQLDRSHVRFLGVDVVDTANSALDFDAHVTPPVRYPSVFDPDRKVAIALNVDAPPYTMFVDRNGKFVADKFGAYSSTAELQADIRRYLHVPT